MSVDVLLLYCRARDVIDGGDPGPYREIATPGAVREIAMELLAARMVVTAVRECLDETDPARRKEAWKRVRTALYACPVTARPTPSPGTPG